MTLNQKDRIMKSIKIIQSFFLILIAVLITSCFGIFCVNGNGVAVTEERTISDFDGITNETSVIVEYERGDKFSVFIEADENLLEYISTTVRSGILEIEVKGTSCIKPAKQAVIYITAPSLNSFYSSGSGDMFADTLTGNRADVVISGSGDIIIDYINAKDTDLRSSGSGDIIIEYLRADDMFVKLTGSGDLTAEGESDMLDINSTGSGAINFRDLVAEVADVLISGSGNIHLSVSDELFAVLTGSGNLYYYGAPSISQTITGSGNLIHLSR